jgi:hypothetical protein
LVAPVYLPTWAHAQQTVTFLCAAPAGHVCQYAVQTGGSQVNFALPSGERKEVPGITPHADKYCVCDPGPVTPDCKAPQLDHWCMGSWLDVDPGVNSLNDKMHDDDKIYGGFTQASMKRPWTKGGEASRWRADV